MTHSAQQGDVEMSHPHNVAICKEIGEQLAIGMKPKPAGMSPPLMMLMRRLRDETLSRLAAPSRSREMSPAYL
jgi:hypothetical protein